MKKMTQLMMSLAVCMLMATVSFAQSEVEDAKVRIADAKEFTKWITGGWEVDTDKSLELAEKNDATDEQIASIEEMGDMSVKFVDDGALDIKMAQFELDGEWEVEKFESKEDEMRGVIYTMITDPGGSSQEMNLNVIVRSKNEIKIWPDNEDEANAIIMIRVKSKKDK